AAPRQWGLAMLAVQPGERVLEVGCGTGQALPALSATAGPAGQVVGLDLSSGMLGVARAALARIGERHITLVAGDARALSFSDAVFDAVFMSFTLELFERQDAARVLRDVRRVLRPHGRLGLVALADT